jgi:hypothetical protein
MQLFGMWENKIKLEKGRSVFLKWHKTSLSKK